MEINLSESSEQLSGHLSKQDKALLKSVNQCQDVMLKQVLDWAAVNSGSNNSAGLETMASLLIKAFSHLDAKVEAVQTDPIETIDSAGKKTFFQSGPIISVRARPRAPTQIILTGHYDTVFAPGVFEKIKDVGDGKINGPGLADMKGGLCVMLTALSVFEQGPLKDKLGYEIVLTPDEETGNFGSAEFLKAAAKRADIGLTFEPAMEDGGMVAARKGSAIFDIIIHGRASHAGRAPQEGRNAMSAAAQFVSAIEALTNKHEGVTFNVGKIDGGGPVNIVPDLAIVRLGVRAPDNQAAQRATEQVHSLFETVCKRDGISGRVRGGFYRPPKPRNAAQDFLISQVSATAGAMGLSLSFADTGGVCEGNNVFAAGTPNIDTLGVRGGRIHSNDEFIIVESLSERAGLTGLILNRLADGRIAGKAIKALMDNKHGT